MPVPVQTPYIEYTGNGLTTSFPLTFDCEKAEFLIVTINGTAAVVGSWSLAGGNVVFTTPPAVAALVIFKRSTPSVRTANYQQYDNSFRPLPVNKDFDKIWIKLQELGVEDWLLWRGLNAEIAARILADEIERLARIAADNLEIAARKAADLAYSQQSIERDNALQAYLINKINGVYGDLSNQLDIERNERAVGDNRVNLSAREYIDFMLRMNVSMPIFDGVTDNIVILKSGRILRENIDDKTGLFKENSLMMDNGRTQRDKNAERVSIKDFGAIGDGTLHTVQEWINSGKYTNLAAIQAIYPHVTASTDSIDWAATQKAVSTAPNVFCPKGNYVLNKVVKTPHNLSPYDLVTAKGLRIFGDGAQTKFTRSDSAPATRIYADSSPYTTQASDDANLAEACFSIHSPYTYMSDLAITAARVGIYLGQDYVQPFTSLSNVTKSNFYNLQIDKCGTGILLLASGGNHYCTFEDIHFMHNQIDVHQRAGNWWGIVQSRGDSNNNRNIFNRIRSARSRIGLWNECGDTNNYSAWHGETMPSSNNLFARPHGLPVDLTASTCLFVFSGSNQLNILTGAVVEACEWHLYNKGYANRFVDAVLDEAYVTLIDRPSGWSGRYVAQQRGIGYRENSASAAFAAMGVAGATYIGLESPNGVRAVAKDVWHQPATSTRGSYKKEFAIETGEIQANTATAVTVWGNTDSSSCAMIEIDVVGRCDATSQIASFNTKAIVNVYRASTRSPSRYGLIKLHSSRATGENVLDSVEANHISLTVRRNPDVTQEIQIVLSCPFLLTSATIFVKLSVTK